MSNAVSKACAASSNLSKQKIDALRHINSYDWLRALGALAIVFLHVVISSSLIDELWDLSPDFFLAEFCALVTLSRWAVPAFFMISGSLLLDPQREMPFKKLAKHIWRIAFILLSIGFSFCILEEVYTEKSVSISVFVTAFLNLVEGKSWGHLWYLYATLGLYVITPTLRWLCSHLKPLYLLLFSLVCWLVCCFPSLVTLLQSYDVADLPPSLVWLVQNSHDSIAVISNTVGWAFPLPFYLFGEVFARYRCSLSKKNTLSWVIVFASLVVLVLISHYVYAGVSELQLPEYGLILPVGFGVMVLAHILFDEKDSVPYIVQSFSRDSFGIYVFHPLFIHVVFNLTALPALLENSSWQALLVMQLVLFCVALLGSCVTTHVLRNYVPGFMDKL